MKLIFAFVFVVTSILFSCTQQNQSIEKNQGIIKLDTVPLSYILSPPDNLSDMSLEETLSQRRSHRNYQDKALSDKDISQILWAAYGISKPLKDYKFLRGGLRTAPSAGALYPLEIYILIGNVKNIKPGVYKYTSDGHKITQVIDIDIRKELCAAALNQKMIQEAPAVLLYSAIFNRTTDKYGDRGKERYVCMDLGHSAQNVYLQVETLHLGTCAIGAFIDEKVKELMNLPSEEEPLYIMPIGHYFNK